MELQIKNKGFWFYVLQTIKWFDLERAIGVAFLIKAALYAIIPIRDSANTVVVFQTIGIDSVLVGVWFLISGLYLLKKGDETNSFTLFLCISPVFLISGGTVLIKMLNIPTTSPITFDNITSEITIVLIILHRIIQKLTIEIINGIRP